MKKIVISLLAGMFLCLQLRAQHEIAIVGPTCVLAGAEYQYNIAGNLGANPKLCVSGGVIVGSTSTCTSDAAKGYVKIIWNPGASGRLSLTSSAGTASLSVKSSKSLDAGRIAQQVYTQTIISGDLPQPLTCTAASGGACSPSYSYQWQASVDNLSWKDIKGADQQDLTFTAPVTQSKFYRRKTVDQSSETTVYTQGAVIYVEVDLTKHN